MRYKRRLFAIVLTLLIALPVLIYVGFELGTSSPETISPTATPLSVPPISNRYQVQEGDTLQAIALEHNTTVEALIALNEIDDPTVLRIGQTLILPITATPTP